MSARIDICNFALSFLGEARITSLDDDHARAQVMSDFYYIAKDACLEDANWTFAMKRFTPAESATAPAFGWSYAYPIPSDILRVTAVLKGWQSNSVIPASWDEFPEEKKSAHVIEGNEILSNDNPIYCYGIRKMPDEGGYSPLFVETFGYKLAYLAASPLSASTTRADRALGLYAANLKKAKTRDSMQNSTRRMRSNILRYSR